MKHFRRVLGIFTLGILFLLPAKAQQREISGRVNSEDGYLPGVSVVVKGTTIGTITDADGKYHLKVPATADTLVFSFVGMQTVEVPIGNRQTIDVTMQKEVKSMDEVVVVGYGIQKKVNVTGAVSVAKKEDLENRPVTNTQRALQGLVPNLQLTTTTYGGEPGAGMNMNIRGLLSLQGSSSPYVLVDGIPMDMNNVDPDDIESISVLKDAASSAIYGARAAYGVVLITTKSGKNEQGRAKISYNDNFAFSQPTIIPEIADPMSFALAMNDAAKNAHQNPYYDQDALNRLQQNIEHPGSAVTMYPKDDLKWNTGVMGLGCAATTDWNDVLFKDWGFRQKHNLSISGGTEKANYYFSTGYYDESGLMRYGNEYYDRLNLDAKLEAQATKWMKLAYLVKYATSEKDFPWDYQWGHGRIFDVITKLKPTLPLYYPNPDNLLEFTDIFVSQSQIPRWQAQREHRKYHQLVMSPRIIIEPLENWQINMELNYRQNNDKVTYLAKQYWWLRPNKEKAYVPPRPTTRYAPSHNNNSYLSPNIYSSWFRNFGDHFFKIMIGYQQEQYKYDNISANAYYLLSDAVPSISTSVGDKKVDDAMGHWATQSYFGRINYNFKEKYILEINFRADGSSKFAPGDRWGYFPSFSGGYVISKESFFPVKDLVDFLKLRISYGSLGNQNVANYLYIPTMGTRLSNFLFNGEQLWTVTPPNLTSVNLTWEKVKTTDVGMDLRMFNNRLSTTFDWYQSYTTDLVGPGEAVPALLGTSVPKKNNGEVRIRGWEIEIAWNDKIGDFSYGIRGVLSDYNRVVTKYNNPTKILSTYYVGKELGEIWGFETAGLFQTEQEVLDWGVDQSFIRAKKYLPGDLKYVDQNDDQKIDVGDYTLDNHGDMKVIGNSTPRYQYGVSGNIGWKGIDFSFFIQGIGKRDMDIRSGTMRGPAQGKYHATVYKEHLDYWRDDSSPLGANPNAYFPRPYSQNPGDNNKNWRFPTTHFIQNGAYMRLKSLQLGYTLPSKWTRKAEIDKFRVYLSGENLLTFTKLLFYDPETIYGNWWGAGKAYPLSKVISVGVNLNF